MQIVECCYRYMQDRRRARYLRQLQEHGLELGNNVTLVGTFFIDPSHCYAISIGDDTVICPNVRLIAHDASTKRILGYTKLGLIAIEEGCFIGDSAIVLPNVRIGAGSIVGAGSVVTRSVEPGTVVAGNPARPVCSVQQYSARIDKVAQRKGVFGAEYWIERLDSDRTHELVAALDGTMGFIV